jgi:chemotaxis protein methyltransferase CheR
LQDRTYALLVRKIGEYKAPQMRRRLEAFCRKQTSEDEPLAFIRTLGANAEVLTELRDMLTINVSEFFRDPTQWETLRRTLLPQLLERQKRVRIWSAACSNGQEPFSFAMLLDELGAADRVEIRATDMDRGALARARAGGPYPQSELKQISTKQRATYLEERDGQTFVADGIRKRPRFAEMNLLKDRFQSGFDLIACRHVMIYFSPEVKAQLLHRLGQSLAPGGLLFIGGTEALVGVERTGYDAVSGNFYQRSSSGELRAA